MTLPRNLTEEERKYICAGLLLSVKELEQELIRSFNKRLDERKEFDLPKYEELIHRIKSMEKLYKIIGQYPEDLGIWLYSPKEENEKFANK